MANKAINELLKYSRMKFNITTPNMTSNSQDGYTILEAPYTTFNTSIGGSGNYNNWHPGGVISCPTPFVVTSIIVGTGISYNYVGTSERITFYRNNVAVGSQTINPRDNMGKTIAITTPVECDKIDVDPAYGSIWDGGSYNPGFRFSGHYYK